MMDALINKRLILASASPRRQQLLKDAGFAFEVRLKSFTEDYPSDLPPHEVPVYLASRKASFFSGELEKEDILITADTVVCIQDRIIEKPAGREEAIDMLSELSGKKHLVVTGVCITSPEKQLLFSSHTDVFFRSLTQEEIVYYVDNYQPYDKAGAYGIQEWIGYIGITRIEGSFYNVMGLPIQKLYEKLKEF